MALEERVTRAELQDSVQEAVAEARQIIARLEAENAQLVQVRGQLHEQVQTALKTQQALSEWLENSAVEHCRLNEQEQRRMADGHLAEVQALRQELAQAQAVLEERVTRTELQDSV